MRKIKTIFIALIMINIIFLVGCLGRTEQNTRPVLDPELLESSGYESIVWLIPPVLEFSSIVRCASRACGAFLDAEYRSIAINTQTGLPEEHRCFTGFETPFWLAPFVYDPQRSLFGHPGIGYKYGRGLMERMGGLYPLEEIMSDDYCRFGYTYFGSMGFISVESVDSSLRETFENDEDREFFLTPEAHSGKFALMYNRVFLTDFIFDEAMMASGGFFAELFAVRMEDRWGVMDKNGDIVLPFVFEAFLRIDNYTAFAKYNGGYGILDLRGIL